MNPLFNFPMDQVQAMQGQAPMQTPQGLTPQFGPALPDQPQQMSLSPRPMRRADKLRLKVDAAGAKQDVTTSMSYIQNQIALSQAREQAINEEIQRIQGTLTGGQIPKPQDPQFSQNQLYATGINYLLGGNIGQTATYFNQDNQKHAEQDYQRRLAQYQQERDMLDMQLKQKYGVSQDERNYQQQLGGMQIQEQFQNQRDTQKQHQDAITGYRTADSLPEKMYFMEQAGIVKNSPIWNAEVADFEAKRKVKEAKSLGDDKKRYASEVNGLLTRFGDISQLLPYIRPQWEQLKAQYGDAWDIPPPEAIQGLKTVAAQSLDETKRYHGILHDQWIDSFNYKKDFDKEGFRVKWANVQIAREALGTRQAIAMKDDEWKRFGLDMSPFKAFNTADIALMRDAARSLQKRILEKAAQGMVDDKAKAEAADLLDQLNSLNKTIEETAQARAQGKKNPNAPFTPGALDFNAPSGMTGPIGGGQPKKGGGTSKGVSGSYNYKGAKVTVRGG